MDLDTIITDLGAPEIVVIGDLMLDVYRFGRAGSMSHESPVPVLRLDRTEYRLGGAAGVASMIKALGGEPILIGVLGADYNGQLFKSKLKAQQINPDYILTMPGRCTTTKERVVGVTHGTNFQQMLRVDSEDQSDIPYGSLEPFVELAVKRYSPGRRIVLISDYAKGVCTRETIGQLVRLADFTIADPTRSATWAKYLGVSCLTPNRQELSALVGKSEQVETVVRAAELLSELCEKVRDTRVIAKLDRDGMLMSQWPDEHAYFKAVSREVSDPTGAGDMVLACLGMAVASGLDYTRACRLANHAGGLVVERFGSVSLTRRELLQSGR